MQGLPTLTEQLYAAAHDVYGDKPVAVNIGYRRIGSQGYWTAHICLVLAESIWMDGATPQAAYDAALAVLRGKSVNALSEILGCKLVA